MRKKEMFQKKAKDKPQPAQVLWDQLLTPQIFMSLFPLTVLMKQSGSWLLSIL